MHGLPCASNLGVQQGVWQKEWAQRCQGESRCGTKAQRQRNTCSRNFPILKHKVATGWCNAFFFNLVMSLCDDLEQSKLFTRLHVAQTIDNNTIAKCQNVTDSQICQAKFSICIATKNYCIIIENKFNLYKVDLRAIIQSSLSSQFKISDLNFCNLNWNLHQNQNKIQPKCKTSFS